MPTPHRVAPALFLAVFSSCLGSWAEAADARQAGETLVEKSTTELIGWRNDGSGHYDYQGGPVAGEAVTLWETPLPHRSNASPILAGDRVFVTAEPNRLICLSATDGQILWERTTSYLDLADEPSLTEDVCGLIKQAEAAQLKKFAKDGLELEYTARMEKDLQELPERFRRPDVHLDSGYSTPTPVSDGENVYVLYGTGLVSSFTLDGERRWNAYPSKPSILFGHSSSPILCEGKLILHTDECVALDLETGEPVWRRPARYRWATPAVIPGTPLIVLGGGEVIRGTDGQLMADLFPHTEPCDPYVRYWGMSSPVVDGHSVYFVDASPVERNEPPSAQRFDLTITDEAVSGELRWTKRLRLGKFYASPVVTDERLFVIPSTIRGRNDDIGSVVNRRADGTLLVFDKEDGEILEGTRELGRDTGVYHTCSLAGNRLWITGHNGKLVVLSAEGTQEELARLQLAPTRSHPLFVGRDLIYRGDDSVARINLERQ